MNEPFLSLKESAKSEIVVKRSRFICCLEPVATPEEAEKFLEAVRKEHYNATHNCSAVVLGPNAEFVKASDDGEPQGTAGLPMLEVLRRSGVRNLIAVVTRYFGGTLLGAPGLVRAYSGSVAGTLENAKIVQNMPGIVCVFRVPYADYGKVQSVASAFGAAVDGDFAEDVKITATMRQDTYSAFCERMTTALLGAFSPLEERQILLEEPAQVHKGAGGA